MSLFWISLELQTENLLMTNEHAHDISSARLACLVAKDFLEVVLQETLVRPFSGKQFESCCNFAKCCLLQIAEFLHRCLLVGMDGRGRNTGDQQSQGGNLHVCCGVGGRKENLESNSLNIETNFATFNLKLNPCYSKYTHVSKFTIMHLPTRQTVRRFSLFWISLEPRTENLSITPERAEDR